MATLTETGSLAINYKGKLFKEPKCDYQFAAEIPESNSEEATKLVQAAFKKLWASEFEKLKKKKAKDIKTAMERTEADMVKKAKKEGGLSHSYMDEFVKTANKMIEQGIDSWRKSEVPALVQKVAEKCYEYAAKKLNREIMKKAVKSALKITALVLIILGVAAASIALTVVTAGAGAPAIAGAAAAIAITAIGAGVSVYKTLKKEAIGLDKSMKQIEEDLKKIDEAYAYQEKKQVKVLKGGKLGPKEKVKLFMNGVGPHITKLKKHMDDAGLYVHRVRADAKKAMDSLMEAEEKLREAEDANPGSDVVKEIKIAREERYKAGRSLEKLMEKLGQYEQLKSEVNKSVSDFEKKGEWKSNEKASKLVRFLQDHQEFAMTVGNGLATIFKTVKKVVAKLG